MIGLDFEQSPIWPVQFHVSCEEARAINPEAFPQTNDALAADDEDDAGVDGEGTPLISLPAPTVLEHQPASEESLFTADVQGLVDAPTADTASSRKQLCHQKQTVQSTSVKASPNSASGVSIAAAAVREGCSDAHGGELSSTTTSEGGPLADSGCAVSWYGRSTSDHSLESSAEAFQSDAGPALCQSAQRPRTCKQCHCKAGMSGKYLSSAPIMVPRPAKPAQEAALQLSAAEDSLSPSAMSEPVLIAAADLESHGTVSRTASDAATACFGREYSGVASGVSPPDAISGAAAALGAEAAEQVSGNGGTHFGAASREASLSRVSLSMVLCQDFGTSLCHTDLESDWGGGCGTNGSEHSSLKKRRSDEVSHAVGPRADCGRELDLACFRPGAGTSNYRDDVSSL